MDAKANEHLKEQTDEEIRRQLEQIITDITEYRAQTSAFTAAWEELAPKIESWSEGGDATILLEYQNRAETLVREYYGNSRLTFSAAADKADAIGREGAEMTKRRIIQNSLQRLAHHSLDARNRWILAARGVAPRYNVELKASQETVRDLMPRIDELKEQQKEKLVRQLTDARNGEHKVRLAALQEAVDNATRRHESLSDDFLKLDAGSADETAGAAEAQELKTQIQSLRDEIAKREKEVAEMDAEIARVESAGSISAPAVAKYAALDSTLTPVFDLGKKNRAIGYGAGTAVFFILIGLVVAASRRNQPAVRHS
jgi:hypothetical protein